MTDKKLTGKMKDRKVSITFQALNSLKEAIGVIASSMGWTRMDGETTKPEITPAIVSMLEFVVAHEKDYRAWLANGKRDVAMATMIQTNAKGESATVTKVAIKN